MKEERRKKMDMSSIATRFLFCVMALTIGHLVAYAQKDTLRIDPIQVLARPAKESIVLRWAPIASNFWIAANKQGYTIERYTLVRDGKALAQPEKNILTPTPIKPYLEKQWEKVVGNNKYAIIAAQALLGETFELDMKQTSTASIVNKVTENEQRFSIALFCADMSVITAKALGLYYTDKDVKPGEKYLYRIISVGRNEASKLMGSVFVSPDDAYKLTAPVNFSVQVKERLVELQWNQSYHKRVYTAYQVERSEDGKSFKAITDDPVVSLAPYSMEETEFQYSTDSLPGLGKDYYYRVKGITPFGENGPPSEVRTVKGKKVLNDLPYITSARNIDNKSISLTWSFPEEYNDQIDGFLIERSPSPSGRFDKAHGGILNKTLRAFNDGAPNQTNYYRVTAQTTDKAFLKSMLYYAQLVDSIPPSVPEEIKGTIDEYGNVALTWKANSDPDIFGYRVYRAYYTSDEFAQLTAGPIPEPRFNDRVDVKSLNEKIHYKVMAIDRNQNHSQLSAIYSISLPDKVPPVSPVFLPIKSTQDGVSLNWLPSSSTDVVQYDLYRKAGSQWIRIASIQANADSIYQYDDVHLDSYDAQFYTVVAIDEANLESPPANAVSGQKLKRSIWPEVSSSFQYF